MTLRAALYARLSVDRDATKIGIDNQITDTRALAKRLGVQVVEEYIDRNLTAADPLIVRPEYDRMARDALAGAFDLALVWDLDRLTRQPRQLEDWIDLAEGHRRYVITCSDAIDLRTDPGKMHARIKAAMARQEIQQMRKRARRNSLARAKNGVWHGGSIPFGYRADAGKLFPRWDEVATIKEAARRILAGDTLGSIVKDWNDAERWTRQGKHWRQSNLRSILMNRSLLGETKVWAVDDNGEVIEPRTPVIPGTKAWEPVIDEATFDRLGRIFSDPTRKTNHSPGVKGGKYSLSGGLSVCGTCGHRLITGGHHGYTALKCLPSVNGPTACGRLTIRHDYLEEYVFEKVIAALEANPRWGQRQSAPSNAKVDGLEAQRADLLGQRKRLARGVTLGLIEDADAKAEAERIRVELVKVERDVNLALGQTIREANITGIADWREWSPMRRRNFLRQLVERVVVNPHQRGLGNAAQQRSSETPEQYEARKREYWRVILDARVVIVPR